MTASIHLLLPKTAQESQEGDQDASPDLPPNPFKHQTCKETIRTLLYDVDGLSTERRLELALYLLELERQARDEVAVTYIIPRMDGLVSG